MRRRRVLGILLAGALALGGVVGVGAPAHAATPNATVVAAPRDGGIVRSGQDLFVDVRITNTGDVALPKGALAFSVDRDPVAGSVTLLSALAKPPAILLGQLLPKTTATTPVVQPGAGTTVRVKIDRTELAATLSDSSGSRVLYVRYRAGTDVLQKVAVTAVTRMTKGFTGRIRVGTIVPITAPAGSTGVVDTASQEALTSPGGAWEAGLDAARADPSATVALDPAVIASIRLAGDDAPESATEFLTALEELPNEVLRLRYADADVTLERAAGAAKPVEPSSFAGVGAVTPDTGSTGSTPAPTPSPSATTAPDAASLLDWSWSPTDVVWPLPGTTSTDALTELGAGGATVILGSGDVQDVRARISAGPRANVDGTNAVVADQTSSALLNRASGDGPEANAALATLVGVLGSDAVSGEAKGVLLTATRAGVNEGLGRVLDTLRRSGWTTGASVRSLATTGTATTVRLKSAGVAPDRAATARDLLQQESLVRALGAATSGGSALIAPERLALAGLLSSSWAGRATEWRAAAAAGASRFASFVGQVRIVRGDDINNFGDDSLLPVSVENRLPRPVTVVVHGTASNNRLQITGTSTVTVPANSRKSARLPTRSINNGKVQLFLRLTTPKGVDLGGVSTRTVTVRAGLETLVAALLLAALGVLFLTGVYRNFLRRRKTPKETEE